MLNISNDTKLFMENAIQFHQFFKFNRNYKITINNHDELELIKQFLDCDTLLLFVLEKVNSIHTDDDEKLKPIYIKELTELRTYKFDIELVRKIFYNSQSSILRGRYRVWLTLEIHKDFGKILDVITLFADISPTGGRKETPDKTHLIPESERAKLKDDWEEE